VELRSSASATVVYVVVNPYGVAPPTTPSRVVLLRATGYLDVAEQELVALELGFDKAPGPWLTVVWLPASDVAARVADLVRNLTPVSVRPYTRVCSRPTPTSTTTADTACPRLSAADISEYDVSAITTLTVVPATSDGMTVGQLPCGVWPSSSRAKPCVSHAQRTLRQAPSLCRSISLEAVADEGARRTGGT
jgi:hypothetical protein